LLRGRSRVFLSLLSLRPAWIVQNVGALPLRVSDARRAIRGAVTAQLHQFVFLLRGSGFPVPEAADEMAHHAFKACWEKHPSRKSVAIAAKRRMTCALGSTFGRRANETTKTGTVPRNPTDWGSCSVSMLVSSSSACIARSNDRSVFFEIKPDHSHHTSGQVV